MTTAEEREACYDEEVAPALREIARKCEQHGLSFLAICEWEPGDYGRALLQQSSASPAFRLTNIAAKSEGNADVLINSIIEYGRRYGHDSIHLAAFGVPTTPQPDDNGG